ncbi:MAG: acyl-CoA dehydrogenase family protein [Blastomonas fulva]|uniref:acyl-CoA dehydrogenase family protein n=1 Tax=Blastomonas fulva TaxID=1550728 RepID=UPI0024E2544A|nr:acyl-CoA dehydrogenase family protein [Blastomonas fulva]MDK2756071.1 acyl-CoA dehydrogenase family protein [Blastomonas fulva]
MDLSYGDDAENFRGEVRAFLKEAWQPGERRKAELKAFIADFRRCATDRGVLYRSVPRAYGGSQQPVDVIRAQVIREEFQRARAPMEVGGNGMNMTVPTLLEKGTEEQKDLFIRKTIEGEYIWGQGYSEPGAGSDLASVRTKGELSADGTKWIINGQKIWTSQGMASTHMFMLVRTEPDASKHDGITYLLIDLDQPGITRRPIRQMTGEGGFCEFFFDNAETPVSWQVGERGQGWYVSRTTLKHERASIGSADGLGNQFAKLVELARETGRNADPVVRDHLARIEGFVMAHRYTSFRLFSCAAAGEDPGPVSLMMKLALTEIGHEMALLAQELAGDALLREPARAGTRGRGPEKWLDQIMGSLGNSIAGGASNIQRNIIAERGLGLPRDLAMQAER